MPLALATASSRIAPESSFGTHYCTFETEPFHLKHLLELSSSNYKSVCNVHRAWQNDLQFIAGIKVHSQCSYTKFKKLLKLQGSNVQTFLCHVSIHEEEFTPLWRCGETKQNSVIELQEGKLQNNIIPMANLHRSRGGTCCKKAEKMNLEKQLSCACRTKHRKMKGMKVAYL